MSKPRISKSLRNALGHHRDGRWEQAEAIYREMLSRDPDCVEALHCLGVLALQSGRLEQAREMLGQAAARAPQDPEILSHLGDVHRRRRDLEAAAACYRHAVELQPSLAESHNNLGITLSALARPGDAAACFRQAIALRPNTANYHYNLGLALMGQGSFPAAIDSFRKTLSLQPDFAGTPRTLGTLLRMAAGQRPDAAELQNNLGCALLSRGDLDEALASFREALAAKPGLAEAHNNLGNALLARGDPAAAAAAFRLALAHRPDFADACGNLGNALVALGGREEAADCYRRALVLNPSSAAVHCNFGSLLAQAGRLDEALTAFRQAIQLKPDLADAHNNVGSLLKERGQLDESLAAYRRAISLQPGFADAYNNLGNLLLERRQLVEALACFREAVKLQPGRPDFQSNVILALQYRADETAAKLESELRRWNQHHAKPLPRTAWPHDHDRTPDRRLRIGYVSPDFRMHAVAFFLLPLLEAHDHEAHEIRCYATNPAADAITARFQACADGWVSLAGLSDAAAADRIRSDRIDVLIDLAGHFSGNRLPVFARRPAPVQVTYLGYPGSTGLEAIDYRLTDHWADPPDDASEYHSEQIERLPSAAWCFSPLSGDPPVGDPPWQRRGEVTFGCFNNSIKVTDAALQLWARLLHRVPASRLLLKNQAVATSSVAQRIITVLSEAGISRDRLELVPHLPSTRAHLQCYDRVDLALDTFPYHGTTTTCEALWMGVPVVTLAGRRHLSRVGVSLLTNAGLPEFIARHADDYLEVAAAAAADRPRLAALRSSLRERLQRSPLMDAARLARAVEAAYRSMWRRWCERPVTGATRPGPAA